LSSQIKFIASSVAVRRVLVEIRRTLGHQWGIVADGRDIWTTVFPDAEVKVFLVGDINVRAQRRHAQWLEHWRSLSLDEAHRDIIHRDEADYLGSQAIHYKANDAIEIDTSMTTIEEQIERVYHMCLNFLTMPWEETVAH
jgi:cytidylate kinase